MFRRTARTLAAGVAGIASAAIAKVGDRGPAVVPDELQGRRRKPKEAQPHLPHFYPSCMRRMGKYWPAGPRQNCGHMGISPKVFLAANPMGTRAGKANRAAAADRLTVMRGGTVKAKRVRKATVTEQASSGV